MSNGGNAWMPHPAFLGAHLMTAGFRLTGDSGPFVCGHNWETTYGPQKIYSRDGKGTKSTDSQADAKLHKIRCTNRNASLFVHQD